jgi:hypothetical protein
VNVSSGNSKTVTVKNTGDFPLKISGVTELGEGFGFSNLSAGVSLAPNQQHVVQVSFRPQSKGTISGRISIMGASLASPTTLSLEGSGVAPTSPPTPPLTPPPANSSSLLPSASSTAVPGQLTIHLGWAASGSPVVGYRVHRGITTGGPYPNYTSDPLPTLDYIDTSAEPGATYYYVVTSIDSSGTESAYSNEVSATLTTTASNSASGLGPSILESPAISASPQQTTPPVQFASPPVIHLSWAPSESAVAGYRVYRSQLQSGPYVDYNSGPLDALSFDDSSVIPGATYFYVVTSLDSEGDESVYSNQAAVAVPAH